VEEKPTSKNQAAKKKDLPKKPKTKSKKVGE
jgi:hypothetical protein